MTQPSKSPEVGEGVGGGDPLLRRLSRWGTKATGDTRGGVQWMRPQIPVHLSSLPVAGVTNDHKLSGLKQHTLVYYCS